MNAAPAPLDPRPACDHLLLKMLALRAAVTASAERRLTAMRDCFPPDGAGACTNFPCASTPSSKITRHCEPPKATK